MPYLRTGYFRAGYFRPGYFAAGGPAAAATADSLQEAVRLFLAADSAIMDQANGGVQPDMLTPGSGLPAVVVVDPQDGVTDFLTTSGDCVDRGTIQVSVYAEDVPDQLDVYSAYDNRRNARRIAGLVANVLNDAPLTFRDGKLVYFRQSGPPGIVVEKHTGYEGNPLRHQFVLFDYIVSRNIKS
jgi:hypothetical protein